MECAVAVGEVDPDRAAAALLDAGVEPAVVKQGARGVLGATRIERVVAPAAPSPRKRVSMPETTTSTSPPTRNDHAEASSASTWMKQSVVAGMERVMESTTAGAVETAVSLVR